MQEPLQYNTIKFLQSVPLYNIRSKFSDFSGLYCDLVSSIWSFHLSVRFVELHPNSTTFFYTSTCLTETELPIPSEVLLDDVGLKLSEEDVLEVSLNQLVLSEFDQGGASLVDRCRRLLHQYQFGLVITFLGRRVRTAPRHLGPLGWLLLSEVWS